VFCFRNLLSSLFIDEKLFPERLAAFFNFVRKIHQLTIQGFKKKSLLCVSCLSFHLMLKTCENYNEQKL